MYKLTDQKKAAKAALMQAREQLRPVIKMGIDAHSSGLVIAVQYDETMPKPGQKISADALVAKVAQWRAGQAAVICCYETGPLGFGLQRRLAAAGAHCLVVRARLLDEYGSNVKTDRRDAAALACNLDRWLHGNPKAMEPVAIPTEQEELRRTLGRERQHLAKERRRQMQHFRGVCLYHGVPLNGDWSGPKLWPKYRALLPAGLAEQGDRLLERVAQLDAHLTIVAAKVAQELPAARPLALGELTAGLIEGEIVQWERFTCRQQVASYTGLVPSEHTSGDGTARRGPITKHGNPLLRYLLIEAAWRLVRYQRGYCRVRKWLVVFDDPRAGGGRRKKAIVALARQFAVDLWRWRTGRVTLDQLGLKLAP